MNQSQQYYDSLGGPAITANTILTRTLATFYMTKAQLRPTDSLNLSWDAYREVRFPLRAIIDTVGTARDLDSTYIGPLYAGNSSRRMNIEVRWLGGEPVMLRSVSIRDHYGDLMLGDASRADVQQAHHDFVQAVRELALYNKTGENGHDGVYADRRTSSRNASSYRQGKL
jgi:hypothetical protein